MPDLLETMRTWSSAVCAQVCRAFGAHDNESRVAKRPRIVWGEPIGCGGGECAVVELKRRLDVIECEARVDVFFECAERVNTRVFCAGEPANLIYAVACQVVECAHVFVGIEVERGGICAEFVRMRGDEAYEVAQIAVLNRLSQCDKGAITARGEKGGEFDLVLCHSRFDAL